MPIKIARVEGGPQKLPTTHTCANQIDIPDYPDQTTFNDKLQTAIDSSIGVEMVG